MRLMIDFCRKKIAPGARFFYFSDSFLIRLPPSSQIGGGREGGNLIRRGNFIKNCTDIHVLLFSSKCNMSEGNFTVPK